MISNFFDTLDCSERTQDTYQYPDIPDIVERIEQEERAKKAVRSRKRASAKKPPMNKENICVRLGIGAYVSKEEREYYRSHCNAYELAELKRFYAMHGLFGMVAPDNAFSGRGMDRGYTEGHMSTVIEIDGKDTLVMMPTATPDINIDDDSATRFHTVLDVLENNLHEEFDEALRWLTAKYPEDVIKALEVQDATKVSFGRILSKRIETSWDQPLDNFDADVLLLAEFNVRMPASVQCGEHTLLVYKDMKRCVEYRLRYTFDLYGKTGRKTCSGPFGAPVKFFPAEMAEKMQEWRADDILRPRLETYADYIRLADKMLAAVYPEALKDPTVIDGDLLVERLSEYMNKRYRGLKLRLRKEHLGKGCGIKGHIFYSDMILMGDDGKPVKFKAGDIVINMYEINENRPSDLLATIIHECIHVFVDTPCFMLQKMAGKPSYSYMDRNIKWLKAEANKQNSDYQRLERMEKATEKLTAYVMMQEDVFRRECVRLLALYGGIADMPTLRLMLEQLTPSFGASMQMTKIRMKEAGFNKVEGLWNFTSNGERIPDHDVSGEWESGISYTIDRDVAIALLGRSEGFAEALRTGKYVYVNGMYVLDHPKYVRRNSSGKAILTKEALKHAEQCCLSFKPGHRHIDMEFSCGAAARGKKKPVEGKFCDVDFHSEPGTAGYESEVKSYGVSATDWGALAGSLAGTFKEALKTVLDALGMTQQTLANRLGVSRQALDKWLKREEILKRHVVGICIALHVKPIVSFRLIDLAPHHLGCFGADALYMQMICDDDMTVPIGNDVMVSHNYKKLNDGRQFEQDLVDFDEETRDKLRRQFGTELTRNDE